MLSLGLTRHFCVAESPPVSVLFAECDWLDWVSQDYPGKARSGAEWEIRQELVKQRKLARHVCGKVPEAAMYIDAVARESLVPWYELEVGGQSHEVYKLSP